MGLKSGGYWPGNAAKALTNHQSTVILFDADTGKVKVKALGMIGAGHQSAFQMRAAVEQRDFEKVIGWNYHPEMLSRLAETAAELGLPFEEATLEQMGAEADVIISITSSQNLILLDTHVRGGTHIACMGTDTKGKQEVEAALVARATVFTDEIAQAVTIGECQHAVASAVMDLAVAKGVAIELDF